MFYDKLLKYFNNYSVKYKYVVTSNQSEKNKKTKLCKI